MSRRDRSVPDAAGLAERLSELMTLDRAELALRWQQTFGCPAPVACHAGLLRQAVGWQMQAAVFGGLTAAERRGLRHGSVSAVSRLGVGAHLVCVWQGQTHQVTILEEGFAYAGQTWRSLSAIARAITGTAWSGPVFFGIKD